MNSCDIDLILRKYPSLDIKSDLTSIPNQPFYSLPNLYTNRFYLHNITDHEDYISFNDRYEYWLLRLWKDGWGGELVNRFELTLSDEMIYSTLDANLVIIPEINEKRYTAIKRKWTIEQIKKHD